MVAEVHYGNKKCVFCELLITQISVEKQNFKFYFKETARCNLPSTHTKQAMYSTNVYITHTFRIIYSHCCKYLLPLFIIFDRVFLFPMPVSFV